MPTNANRPNHTSSTYTTINSTHAKRITYTAHAAHAAHAPNQPASERLQGLLARLTSKQLEFVAAMQTYHNKKDAALAIGLKPNTVYKWPPYVDEVLYLIAQDAVATALLLVEQHLVKAMKVKVEGLDSEDQGLRQRTASEMIALGLANLASRASTSPTHRGIRKPTAPDPDTHTHTHLAPPVADASPADYDMFTMSTRLKNFASKATPEEREALLTDYDAWCVLYARIEATLMEFEARSRSAVQSPQPSSP